MSCTRFFVGLLGRTPLPHTHQNVRARDINASTWEMMFANRWKVVEGFTGEVKNAMLLGHKTNLWPFFSRLLGGNLLWNNGGNGPGSSHDDSDDDVDVVVDDLGTGGTNIFNSG